MSLGHMLPMSPVHTVHNMGGHLIHRLADDSFQDTPASGWAQTILTAVGKPGQDDARADSRMPLKDCAG